MAAEAQHGGDVDWQSSNRGRNSPVNRALTQTGMKFYLHDGKKIRSLQIQTWSFSFHCIVFQNPFDNSQKKVTWKLEGKWPLATSADQPSGKIWSKQWWWGRSPSTWAGSIAAWPHKTGLQNTCYSANYTVSKFFPTFWDNSSSWKTINQKLQCFWTMVFELWMKTSRRRIVHKITMSTGV